MQAVTFQGVGEVRVEDVPEPEISAADDAVVRIEASGICGSDLHIFHGRYHKCVDAKIFGHGKISGDLQGAQAEQVLVPHANLTLRRAPDAVPDDAALFAGDVLGTGYHAVTSAEIGLGDTVAVLGLGP